MKENPTDSFSSVQNLQNEVDKLIEEYIKSEFFKIIKSNFKTKHNYDLINLIKGLWYYFAVCELPSRTAHTIWAYQDGFISLENIMEGKIWLLKTWDNETLYQRFNEFIERNINARKLRDMYGMESSFESLADNGREWMLCLHNDEKVEIYKKLINSKTINEKEKAKYKSMIGELEAEKNKKIELLEKLTGYYKEIYTYTNELRRTGMSLNKALEKAIDKYKETNEHLNRIIKKNNYEIKDVVNYLHNAYYKTKYKAYNKY